jgi:hypothetical protein
MIMNEMLELRLPKSSEGKNPPAGVAGSIGRNVNKTAGSCF